MKLSYAIPVCNEFVEIQRLITFLLENKRDEDEIVVLFDSNNGGSWPFFGLLYGLPVLSAATAAQMRRKCDGRNCES